MVAFNRGNVYSMDVTLSKNFGDGWLTKSASDLVKIAIFWAGFDAKELITRLVMTKTRGMKINAATVDRIMGEMCGAGTEARKAELKEAFGV